MLSLEISEGSGWCSPHGLNVVLLKSKEVRKTHGGNVESTYVASCKRSVRCRVTSAVDEDKSDDDGGGGSMQHRGAALP